MYEQIKKHPRVSRLYREKLLAKGLLPKSLLDSIESDIKNYLDQQHQNVESGKIQCIDRNLEPGWDQVWEEDLQKRKTGVPLEVLDKVVDNISNLPDSISFNKKMVKFTKSRRESWEADKVDWAFAEALCFGSLLLKKREFVYQVKIQEEELFSKKSCSVQ